MNIEEKAKAYDRALEKARMYRDNAKTVEEYAAVARYENIFPELREEEKPLTPFQQCLNFVLRKVHFASIPSKKENTDKFILDTVKKHTDELVELAKKHECTDCQPHESEDEKMMREFNDWLCEEIECRTSSLCDEKDRRTLNMLCYVLAKFKDWLKKQKEPDYLEKFIRLPHLNSDYEVVDDWAYTPSLAHCDGNWGVCWVHCEDGDTLHECIGDTPAEAIDKAIEWFTSLEKPIRAKEVGAIISSRDKEETACGYLERCLTPDMRKVWYEACDELKKACFQEAEKQKEHKPTVTKPHKGDDGNPYDMGVSEAQEYAIKRGFGIPFNDGEVYVDERHITQTIGNILRWADDHPKEQKPVMGNGISEQTKMNETVYKFTQEEWKKALDEQLPKEQKPVETSDFKTKLAAYLQNNSPEDSQYVISSESILEMAKEELIKRGELKEQKHYWKPTETDVALFNKAVTTNKALTPTERAQLDIIRSKFGCCRAVNCSGIVQKEQKSQDTVGRVSIEVRSNLQTDEIVRKTLIMLVNDNRILVKGSITNSDIINWLKRA